MELRPKRKQIIYLVINLVLGTGIICIITMYMLLNARTHNYWLGLLPISVAFLRTIYDTLFKLKSLIIDEDYIYIENIVTGRITKFNKHAIKYFSSDPYETVLRDADERPVINLRTKYYSNIKDFFQAVLPFTEKFNP